MFWKTCNETNSDNVSSHSIVLTKTLLIVLQVEGVAFKKTFSYAGFEMQKKQYEGPKIAMLNIELVKHNNQININKGYDATDVKW